MARSIRIRRPRVPGPGPPDERRPGEGNAQSDFYGEIANASVKETTAGRRHHLRVPAAGGHQGRLHARN